MNSFFEDHKRDEEFSEQEERRKQLSACAQVAFEVRKAQKKYFKTRKQEDLIESKRLEAALDLRLAELGLR